MKKKLHPHSISLENAATSLFKPLHETLGPTNAYIK
jgi:hypothetical protein